MERSDKITLADLFSHDPPRIQSALVKLKQSINQCAEITTPPFGIELFAPFDAQVPEETQLNFLTVIRKYRKFVPALTEDEKIAVMIALVLRYAERYVAFEVALGLKTSSRALQAVATAMAEISRQGLSSPTSVKGARFLVSRLLDGGNEFRRAALQALSQWPDRKPYQEVVEYILPQLAPDEMRFITKSK